MSVGGFEEHRRRLTGLAYRMLGSVQAAEDIVQETAIRFSGASDIERPGAWLTTVCTRLCLDELSSAYVRREQHVGPWLPEPWVELQPPEPSAMTDSLSMAVLLLLEELNPKERAAFLLREVFEEEYEHIAAVLETDPQNVRQWVRRAKGAIEADRPRFEADPVAQAALLAAFGAAAASGDVSALERLLAEDIVATSDGGGRVHAARKPIIGTQAVARFLVGILRKGPDVELALAWVNGMAGAVAKLGGEVFAVTAIECRDGRISRWRTVLDPEKLRHLQPQPSITAE